MKPEKIERISEKALRIEWDDGKQTVCFAKTLRHHCPCAICQEDRKNKNPLKVVNSDQKSVELTGWRYVGNYAIGLEWSDGHDTGIYTYEFLRQLAEDD